MRSSIARLVSAALERDRAGVHAWTILAAANLSDVPPLDAQLVSDVLLGVLVEHARAEWFERSP